MSETVSTPPLPADAPEAPPARVSLEQFCTELSRTDKRVEMIGAFHNQEKRNARTYDTSDAYASRYDAFTTALPK